MTHLGQTFETAENGEIAVEKAPTALYDLILMDMQMPVMDGIEATELIRAGSGNSSTAPIFAMTANASDDDTRKCMEAGMDGFQSKPVTIEKLRNVIRTAASSRRANPNVALSGTRLKQIVRPNPSDDQSSHWTHFETRRAELVEVFGDDDFRELVDTFFIDARAAIEQLSEALRTSDKQAGDRLLHTVKGAAGNVRLSHISSLAQRLRETTFDRNGLNELESSVDRSERRLAA